jgi:hypothetical protein
VFVIRKEYPAVLVDSETVRPTVIFGNQFENSAAVDSKDPTPGNVDAIEIALAIKRGALQKTIHLQTWQLALGESRIASNPAKVLGQARENFGINVLIPSLHRAPEPLTRSQ